jgi:hypothetical protein
MVKNLQESRKAAQSELENIQKISTSISDLFNNINNESSDIEKM